MVACWLPWFTGLHALLLARAVTVSITDDRTAQHGTANGHVDGTVNSSRPTAARAHMKIKFVHIGKCGGTNVRTWLKQHKVMFSEIHLGRG